MFVIALAAASSAIAQPLQTQFELLASEGGLSECRIGAVLMDAQTGEVLATKDSDESFIPASNMKLITAGTALQILGPDFVFQTELRWDEATGTLVVLGDGDPAFGDPKLLNEMGLSSEEFVDVWADSVAKNHIKNIKELVVDDRVFDREWVHGAWPVDQLNRWYCAEVAGINFHTNCITIYTNPSETGRPAVLETEPHSPWIELANKTRTTSRGNHAPWAARDYQTNDITVFGTIRFATDPLEVTIHDMPTYFGALLEHRLSIAGIEVERVRLVEKDEHLPEGEILAKVRTELPTALERVNVNSQNMYAEALLKRVSHEMTSLSGSWTNGTAAARMVLAERLGPAAGEEIVISDGSGMSRENSVTPRMLASWLRSFHGDEVFGPMLRDSMATPGNGTLRTRFKGIQLDNNVYAKSGYLNGVSALSGYVIDPDTDRTVIFVMLLNNQSSKVSRTTIKQYEEKVTDMLDDWLTEQKAGAGSFGG
ncbi:MAG: D-alanyl-D-alanine carboxypeptidase/D-alanyl-D-alanine-endopeptidase [Planctomycetota bacterium]